MQKVSIVPYNNSYLRDILTCWNEQLCYDVINEKRFIDLVLLDDNFDEDLFKVALIEKTVVGFCYGIKRKVPYLERGLEANRGWISIMAIKQEYKRQGIGTKLINEVSNILKESGCEEITLCAYSPNYFTPGIDLRYGEAIAFVEKLGYEETSQAVSMQRDLWNYIHEDNVSQKRKQLEEEGIRIFPYNSTYLHALLEYLLLNFGAGWKRNALIAMQKQEAEDTIFLCVNAKNEIIGFCMRKIDGNDARFGPFGVSEELRSKGLGGVLFEVMMDDMKKRGIYYLYFLWTNGPAKRFYERHQVFAYRTYNLYRKELKV